MSQTIDFKTVIPKFDSILSRGLRVGLGREDDERMCVEAAACVALGFPRGDDPKCVASSVRKYMIRINDSSWSSPAARATHLRDLGIAQLGSLGVIDDLEFIQILAGKTIKILIPLLLRSVFDNNAANAAVMLAADQCEQDGSCDAAKAAAKAAMEVGFGGGSAAYKAADAAINAAHATNAAHTVYAAKAAEYAAYAAIAADVADAAAYVHQLGAKELDKYLILSAKLALETLRELDSPGARYLA